MDWNQAIFSVVSLHTFSNVWYWLAVAVTWSVASHWILGVPFDMVFRAKRHGGDAMDDLELIVAVNLRRMTPILDVAGLWMAGLGSFILSILFMVGFYYGFEFAQGVFLLGFPLSIATVMNFRLCRRFSQKLPQGELLTRTLIRTRFWIQVIAMLSIFLTSLYGMFRILSLPVGF